VRGVRTWAQQTFAALAIRPFRILWLGTFTSFLAFFMSTIVNSVVAFQLTGANRSVGVVLFAQGLAMFLLVPFGGAFADRWPKRRVVAAGQSTTSTVFLTAAVLVASGRIEVWQLAAGALVLGVCFAFVGPARQALLVEIVPAVRRGNAMALSQVANNASRVGGPAAAGVLLAWTAVGASGAYLVMALLYALAAVSLVLLPRSTGRANPTTNVWSDVLDGLRYLGGQPRLRVLVVLFVAVTMAGFPYVTVLPGLVENQLGHPAEAISLLMGVAAAGGLSSSVLVARLADTPRARPLTLSLALAFGAALVGLAAAPSYAGAVAAAFVLGAASGGFQTLATAVVIHETDPIFIGRVMALTLMAFAGFGLLGLPIGLLADAIGERGALAAMGLTVCAIAGERGLALRRAAGAPARAGGAPIG